MPTFIETQFPIARLSAESYKERKAGASQTLTGLGKWWGRKPLILVRASILGMLMPASDDPKRDREIFLKILTMDDDGVWQRCKGEIPVGAWREAASPKIQQEYFTARGWQRGLTDEEKEVVYARILESLDADGRKALDAQRRRPVPNRATFDALPYAERITHCDRPESIEGPTPEAWAEINSHLGTTASGLPELIEQLGRHTFGHTPSVGDAFCGGGSIPFEAARIGCAAFGSDLNPVAGLLTWASLNLLGGGNEVQEEIRRFQEAVFADADRQITQWGIEHNAQGERAEAYVYCVEVKPDGCDYYIPLAPTWVVDEYMKVIVRWHQVPGSDCLKPEVAVVSNAEMAGCKRTGATVIDSRVVDPFDSSRSWSIEALRGPDGLRRWTNDDLLPRKGDVFQERLYCIRWIDSEGNRRYAAPEEADLARETKVLKLLQERFSDWQREGFIPSKVIVSGYNTDQPTRERGWTHWHHLFTPRQLLTHGLLANLSSSAQDRRLSVVTMLNTGRLADWDSRLSCWLSHKTQMSRGKNTFLNQALNTLFNYSTRPLLALTHAQISLANQSFDCTRGDVKPSDARDLRETCDIWITDPPYADAVNYHELGDFFLAWYDKQLARHSPNGRPMPAPNWRCAATARISAVPWSRFTRTSPATCRTTACRWCSSPTRTPAVWADLGMILWAAGLKATAAWTISTETEAVGIKKGNYVTGTVCLVLRKRVSPSPVFSTRSIRWSKTK